MEIVDSGDDALLVLLAELPSDAVLGLWRALLDVAPVWLIAAQPAYTTLQVVHAADVDVDVVRRFLRSLRPRPLPASERRVIEGPVRYGGDDGPDLDDVAAHAGLDVDEVVRRHSAGRYRVAFCGFVPGFAYLGRRRQQQWVKAHQVGAHALDDDGLRIVEEPLPRDAAKGGAGAHE